MKKMMFLLVAASACMVLFSSSVKRTEKRPGVTITPEKLDLFVNQDTDPYTVKIAYTLNVPANYLESCARLVYQPYLVAEKHQYDLTPVILTGRTYQREAKRLEQLSGEQPGYPDALHLTYTGDGMKISLSQTVPFELWMVKSKLRAAVSVEACDRQRDLYDLTLAKGMFYMPLGPGPVRVEYVPEMTEVQKVRNFSFMYPTGYSTFLPAYDGNARQMEQLARWVDSLRNQNQMQFQKMVITGSCSPSGVFTLNERLAERRALEVKQLVIRSFGISPDKIQIETIPENWEGLYQTVIQSDRPDMKNIIPLLQENLPDDKREALLRVQPQYEYLREHVFPELQMVTCRVFYSRREEVTKVVPL